jgi:cytochrome o ubiquinol oxidase operon protein cyoD
MTNHHDESHEYGGSQKTLKAYVVGFVLCVILTFVAFGLVEKRILANDMLYLSLAGLAIVQLFVQAICFLRLNASPEGRWNLLPFLFTILIMGILVAGSLWIMYNLNYNMYH